MAVWPGFARDLELVKLVLVPVHQWNGERLDLTGPSNTIPTVHKNTTILYSLMWGIKQPPLPPLQLHPYMFYLVFCSPQQSRPTWVVPSWERGCMSYNCPTPDNCVDLELVHFCGYLHHYIQVCRYTFSFESGQLWTRSKTGGYMYNTIWRRRQPDILLQPYFCNFLPKVPLYLHALKTNNNQI